MLLKYVTSFCNEVTIDISIPPLMIVFLIMQAYISTELNLYLVDAGPMSANLYRLRSVEMCLQNQIDYHQRWA